MYGSLSGRNDFRQNVVHRRAAALHRRAAASTSANVVPHALAMPFARINGPAGYGSMAPLPPDPRELTVPEIRAKLTDKLGRPPYPHELQTAMDKYHAKKAAQGAAAAGAASGPASDPAPAQTQALGGVGTGAAPPSAAGASSSSM